jgi:glycosyltransferase involved in cell wall biosynthesis
MQSPLISIIIPAYNHEMFVADAINSVLNQSFADFEIIVIDDGSTDNTLAEIKKIDDPRIRLFHQTNIGAAKTINRGIDLSHGQYITILNSDDMYHPERLALFKRYMDVNPDTMVLSSLVQPVDTLGNHLRPGSGNAFHDYWLKWYNTAVQNLLQDDNYFFTLLQSNFVVSTSNIFLNSRIFQNEDKFPILFYCHDYAFLLQALQSYPFGFIHKHLMQYRLHETNTIRHNHFLKHLEVQYAVFHALNFDEILSSSNLQNKMSSIVFRGLEKNPDVNHSIQLAAEKDVLLQETDRKINYLEKVVAEKDTLLREADRKINYLEKVVAEKEGSIAEKDRFLREIFASRAWRLLTWYRDMKQSLFAKTKTPQTPPEPPAQFDENTYYAKVLHPINPKRTKVIHAIANFHTGGSSRLVVDLIEHLGHKYDQEVISFLIPMPIAYAGVKIHDFSGDVTQDRIETFLKEKNAQILHVHYWGEGDAAWYHKVFRAAEKWQGILIENVNTPVMPYVSDRVNHYVYVSDYARNFATCEAGKSSVIYPGSNLTLFDRHNAPIPDNVIGMVYRLDSDKLKEDAIRVFIQVIKKRPRTKVLIVGGGEFLIAYQKLVAQEEGATANFEFTGYVPYGKLPEYYQQMSIFVAPVWKESFGQVSPFAMSMKIPVAGYQIGALSEILGSNELLATNPDDLSDIIVKLLEDRERRIEIGYNNYLRVHERFSVDAMVTAYNQLYDRLIHEHEIDSAL